MKPPFRLTPTAKADLKQILEDLAEDNPDAAHRMHERFLDGFRTLARSPGVGHYHDELLNRRYRFWNVYPHVVAYAWESKPIQIVAILHGARDLASLLNLFEALE